MPVNTVGSSGYTSIPSAMPEQQAPAHADAWPPAELKASDIPSSHTAHGADRLDGDSVDVSRLRSVPQAEQTPAQREATKATAEKPSMMRRICTGIAGFLCGAVGGIGAGMYAAGGLVGVTVEALSSAPPVAFVGACIAGLAGLALVGVGILGGGIAGAAHGASTGSFKEAGKSIAFPVNFVRDLVKNKPDDQPKDAPPAATT